MLSNSVVSDDDIILRCDLHGILSIKAACVLLNFHMRIDFSKSCSGALKFAQAKTRLAMEYLALEIRKFDGVRINNADAANASSS